MAAEENVDYIVDYYSLLGVDQEADAAAITKAYHARQLEWGPDRLQGLAPEIRAKGERMSRLLNAAGVILRDDEKRITYDDILQNWDGPISTDGTPVITHQGLLRESLKGKAPEDIEASLEKSKQELEAMVGYTPSRLSFLERMLEQSGEEAPADLRTEYEAALLQHDRVLAMQELDRAILLGMPDLENSSQRATSDHANQLTARIETTREHARADLKRRALGGVSTQMALLEGKVIEPTDAELVPASPYALPDYFEPQAARLLEIASQREAVVAKRLANYEPEYPDAELQPTALPNAVIGYRKGPESIHWSGIVYDPESQSIDWSVIPDDVKDLLNANEYAAAIARGYNIVIIEPLDQIDLKEQLFNGIEKYVARYGLGKEDEA